VDDKDKSMAVALATCVSNLAGMNVIIFNPKHQYRRRRLYDRVLGE